MNSSSTSEFEGHGGTSETVTAQEVAQDTVTFGSGS